MIDQLFGFRSMRSSNGIPRAATAVFRFALAGSAWLGSASGQEVLKTALPEAPSALLASTSAANSLAAGAVGPSAVATSPVAAASDFVDSSDSQVPAVQSADTTLRPRPAEGDKTQTGNAPVLDENGKPIRPQTGRIFGIFPNFVSVSGGTKPKPAGWKTDFAIANRQAYDYSSFGFLLISSSLAYAQTSHPSLNTVNGGNAILWAYVWRGFLDKTDGSYQGSFFFPALLHEDTRYYALGTGSPKKRLLHAVLSVVVARSYDGRPIVNAAGLLGKAGSQAVSTTYYPAGSEGFGVLAEKFSYSCLRQAIYAIIREYSPDAQARVHFSKKIDNP